MSSGSELPSASSSSSSSTPTALPGKDSKPSPPVHVLYPCVAKRSYDDFKTKGRKPRPLHTSATALPIHKAMILDRGAIPSDLDIGNYKREPGTFLVSFRPLWRSKKTLPPKPVPTDVLGDYHFAERYSEAFLRIRLVVGATIVSREHEVRVHDLTAGIQGLPPALSTVADVGSLREYPASTVVEFTRGVGYRHELDVYTLPLASLCSGHYEDYFMAVTVILSPAEEEAASSPHLSSFAAKFMSLEVGVLECGAKDGVLFVNAEAHMSQNKERKKKFSRKSTKSTKGEASENASLTNTPLLSSSSSSSSSSPPARAQSPSAHTQSEQWKGKEAQEGGGSQESFPEPSLPLSSPLEDVADWTNFPPELLVEVFGYLSRQDLCSAAFVCRTWGLWANERDHWPGFPPTYRCDAHVRASLFGSETVSAPPTVAGVGRLRGFDLGVETAFQNVESVRVAKIENRRRAAEGIMQRVHDMMPNTELENLPTTVPCLGLNGESFELVVTSYAEAMACKKEYLNKAAALNVTAFRSVAPNLTERRLYIAYFFEEYVRRVPEGLPFVLATAIELWACLPHSERDLASLDSLLSMFVDRSVESPLQVLLSRMAAVPGAVVDFCFENFVKTLYTVKIEWEPSPSPPSLSSRPASGQASESPSQSTSQGPDIEKEESKK